MYPNWEMLVTGHLESSGNAATVVDSPSLSELPEELLPALSKFLFISKDEAEQGGINIKTVTNSKDIVKCLTMICRNAENIPLVSSMDFVMLTTQINGLFLQHLLEMESSFFAHKVKVEMTLQKLKQEIFDFILQVKFAIYLK